MLIDVKTRYPHIQKLLFAVLIAKQKILHYFDSHSITMVTSFPLGEVINNKDTIGHIAEWALELMQYDIAYVPHTTMKVT